MAIDQVDRTTTATEPDRIGQQTVRTDNHETFAPPPPRPEIARPGWPSWPASPRRS